MAKTSVKTLAKPAAITVEVVGAAPTLDERWQKARRYVDSAALFQRASLASQIMAGLELAALHKEWGVKRGRPSTKLPHSVGINREPWEKAVEKHLGISDQTATRWMEMGQAARKRLQKSDLDLATILEKNPGALTAEEQELLTKVVHKISDGKTQLEFLLECGVTKVAQGASAKGGDTRKTATEAQQAEAPGAPAAAAHDALPVDAGWEPIAKKLNDLLVECLGDNYWSECDEPQRRELHGNLLDATRRVAATLKGEKGAAA